MPEAIQYRDAVERYLNKRGTSYDSRTRIPTTILPRVVGMALAMKDGVTGPKVARTFEMHHSTPYAALKSFDRYLEEGRPIGKVIAEIRSYL